MIESLVLRNKVTKEKLQMSMDADARYILFEGSLDWGSVEVTHNKSQFPSQIGTSISSTVLGGRDVSISGWIINDETSIVSKQKVLSRFVNPNHEIEVTVGNYSIVGRPTTSVKFGKERTDNNSEMCKFLISLYCAEPMFMSSNPLEVQISETRGAFGFPLSFIPGGIIMGHNKGTLFTDVVNDGTNEVGMIITMTASGTVNNPELVNVNTGERIRINKTLVAGERVVINTNIGHRSVIGYQDVNSWSYLDYFDYDNAWLQLPCGTSTLTYRTYTTDGVQDNTYKMLSVSIEYKSSHYNLGGE